MIISPPVYKVSFLRKSYLSSKRNETRLVKQIEMIGSAQMRCDLTYSDPFSMYSMTIIGSTPVMTAPMIVVMPVVILPTKTLVKKRV
jgi:hypothetical protein